MKFFLISDNVDSSVGMRLAGIEGIVVHEAEEVEKALKDAAANEEIGIVLITNKLIALCPDLVRDMKLNNQRPLVVEVTDRHGAGQLSEAIQKYVKEAVGISI